MLANKDNSCSSLYVQLIVRIHLTIQYNKVDFISMLEAMGAQKGHSQTAIRVPLPPLKPPLMFRA